jgi:DNA mismatch endonuclease (patch repair protein)
MSLNPYPTPSSDAVSARMRATRRRDTGPEIAVRSALHALGLRYRVDLPIRLPGRRPVRPDVVFTRRRICIFVDGCFWHCCPIHGVEPSRNVGYWGPKLARNVARDRAVDAALADEGWTVVRIWEHDDPGSAAAVIAGLVRGSALDRASARARRGPSDAAG